MADIVLTLPKALELASRETAGSDSRTIGALAAASLFLHQAKPGEFSTNTLGIVEDLLDNIQGAIDKAREMADG